MIHELQQSGSRPLAIDCPSPEAAAVIEGNNPGWVFVDDPCTPKAALVWAQGIEGFYLAGDANSAVFQKELAIFTDQVLKPRLRNLGITWFEISGDKKWNPAIENIFSEQGLESSEQWVYMLKPSGDKSKLQPGAVGDPRLLRVDKHLLGNLPASNKEFLFSKLRQFWGNVNTFLNTGLGYVLLDEEEIASLCCSGFVTRDIHVIDIETEVSHRKKGYAEKVARAFIAACLEKHCQPYWDCMAENTASARLAEKLGFTRSHVYSLYSFPLQSER